ncbi:MAG: hypothetical protein AAF799_43285 [Myxococcota bacterium]
MCGLAALAAGCFAAGTEDAASLDDDYMDDPPPPGDCETDCPTANPGSDGASPGGPCLDSDDCAAGGICAAEFDGEVQTFTCQLSCVPLQDDAQWCADDSSCCEDGAICSARGLCLIPDAGLDDSGTASDTGSDGSGTDGTGGSSSGGSSGSGTGGSSGDAGGSSSSGGRG